MKRHNLLVTPYIERALWLCHHLKAQGIDAKLVTRYAVQVDPMEAEREFEVGMLFVHEQEEKTRAKDQARRDAATLRPCGAALGIPRAGQAGPEIPGTCD